MDLDPAELIRSAIIVPALGSSDKDGVLAEMLAAAVAASRLPETDVDAVRSRLVERERVGSTGIGNHIAVPHTKGGELSELTLVFARSEAGVPYQAIDGKDVHLVFMVLGPEAAAERHLAVLRWISKLARSEDFRRFAVQTADVEGLRELMMEMGL